MSIEYSQDITSDYEKLFETGEESNIIIYAGRDKTVEEIHAHSCILLARSQYFRMALVNKCTSKKNGKYILKIPIAGKILRIILRFIYCGKIDLEQLQGPDILKLLIAVDELDIKTLVQYIQRHLIKHQYNFLQKNCIIIFETVCQYENFTELLKFFTVEEPQMLFNSDKFINLKSSLLELLIKQENLLLDETFIWDNLIKWGFAQEPSIPKDVKKWNKEDITTMKKLFHRFIPLIRFHNISSTDFYLKVYPFKPILPENLVSKLLTIHMTSNKKPKITTRLLSRKQMPQCDSIIINYKHLSVFSSWIEKKSDYYFLDIPYNFNLLYRANRDGDTAAEFHSKCDNKGATIVVLKFSNSEKIAGGYNPIFWDSSNVWRPAKDSFLFSFENRMDLQTAKIVYDKGGKYSIGCQEVNGPVFGCDLYRKYSLDRGQKCWGSQTYSYPEFNLPEYFDVEEYEVFQVTKK